HGHTEVIHARQRRTVERSSVLCLLDVVGPRSTGAGVLEFPPGERNVLFERIVFALLASLLGARDGEVRTGDALGRLRMPQREQFFDGLLVGLRQVVLREVFLQSRPISLELRGGVSRFLFSARLLLGVQPRVPVHLVLLVLRQRAWRGRGLLALQRPRHERRSRQVLLLALLEVGFLARALLEQVRRRVLAAGRRVRTPQERSRQRSGEVVVLAPRTVGALCLGNGGVAHRSRRRVALADDGARELSREVSRRVGGRLSGRLRRRVRREVLLWQTFGRRRDIGGCRRREVDRAVFGALVRRLRVG